MELLKEKIKRKEEQIKRLKAEYKKLFDSLKADSVTYNANYISSIAERVFSLVQEKRYTSYSFQDDYSLGKGSKFIKQGLWEDTNVIIIRKNFYYNFRLCDTKNVGFICKLEDIYEAIYDDEKFKIWLCYCKERKYKKSLEEFYKDCKEKKLNFLEIYDDYLSSKNNFENKEEYLLEIINEPALKIKNMLVYFKK